MSNFEVNMGAREEQNVRTGYSTEAIKQALVDNLHLLQGRLPATATLNDWYMALAYTVRDRIVSKWMATIENYMEGSQKSVSYLSAEFLIGPQLLTNLINLGIETQTKDALKLLGQDLDTLVDQEREPGLGNGGLGRLAACYLDSLASLNYLAVGYGIRYEFGIFKQVIQDGWQVEMADHWLETGNPWEIIHPEIVFNVGFGGYVDGSNWVPSKVLRGVACDVPIAGYRVQTVNLLRLWKAEATDAFNFRAFNAGEYWSAVQEKINSENTTKVLYPNDEAEAGKRLRLEQQYFFVSCSLQDMIRVHTLRNRKLSNFHKHYAIQLNDTHPSIAIAELMRLFVDVYNMDWEEAWDITQQSFGYTNHTLMSEALEKWSLPLFESLLPRHLQIIYEINHRFLAKLNNASSEMLRNVSIIDEHGSKFVCMANLACIGSHAINGVAALHTDLLKRIVLKDLFKLEPEKFFNVTNGVTPRRWLVLSNPQLAELISSHIGTQWICNMENEIHKIEPLVQDPSFRAAWKKIKQQNKERLTDLIFDRTGIKIDPTSFFDIQVKRIHEYKRQHLNVLHIIARYLRMKNNPNKDFLPRTFIFGGKAAPGYFMAKLIIKLINSVADVVNNDPAVSDRLKVVFFPNFNVKNAQKIYPAANLSEQISTAGKEASGTGNMKFAMNGALTIGTLDGANIEIRDAVGAENFFLFGLTTDEVLGLNKNGYNPRSYVQNNPELTEVLKLIEEGFFSPSEHGLFRPLVNHLLHYDEYKVLADFASYVDCQDSVDVAYRDEEEWTKKSILNLARIGMFSSDRAIHEYAEKIWGIPKA